MAVFNEQFSDELKQLYQDFKKVAQNDNKLDEKSGESGDKKKTSDEFENCFQKLTEKIDLTLPKLPKNTADYIKLLSMRASLMYEKAKINLSSNCLDVSQELLANTLALITDHVDDPQITFLYLRTVNHLSYILSRTNHLDKAKDLLEKAPHNFPKSDTLVYSTEDLFSGNKMEKGEATTKLNKLVVNNMQMLGWLYGKLGLYDLHTSMQHKSLQKQLDVADGDPLLWATRCSRLSSLFLTQNKWIYARYHLAASETILDQIELQVNINPDINRAQGELARAWIHYGLHLFSVSKKTMLEHIYVTEDDLTDLNYEQPVAEVELPEEFHFKGIVVNVPSIPVVQICTTPQARELFLHTQKWLKRSRLFYTLRDHPLQYVNSVLDLSELYRFLAFYEQDIESQYNVQKKRYDALEALCTILKEVRPNCYFAVSVDLLKELADVQIELMGLNLKRLYAAEDMALGEEDIKQRINAVSDIHGKLENLEEVLGSNRIEAGETDNLPENVDCNADGTELTESNDLEISNNDKQ